MRAFGKRPKVGLEYHLSNAAKWNNLLRLGGKAETDEGIAAGGLIKNFYLLDKACLSYI